jgi:propanol-preferring alcohol dehydrogenase
VVAVDLRHEALELARHSGADLVLESGPAAVAAIRAATGGHGADVVLDFVGSDSTLATGAAAARMLGDLTVVGIAGGTLSLSFFSIPYEVSVQTTYWGSRPELIEVLDLAARSLLNPVITTVTLDEAVDAYRRMAASHVVGRTVVTPAP